jgi:hypothetical protein
MTHTKLLTTILLTALLTTNAWAQAIDTDRPDRPPRDGQHQGPQRDGDHQRPQRDGEGRMRHMLEAITDETYEFQTDSTNQLIATVTHAIPARDGEGYHAFVIVRWGDLDNELEDLSPDYYANWDGEITISTGELSIMRKLAFDDGTHRPRQAPDDADDIPDQPADETPDAQRNPDGARAGGADEITSETDQAITWTAGVVGATDGLLFRLDLPEGTTSGTVEAGEFEFDFTVTPLSEEELEALRQARREQHRDGDSDRPHGGNRGDDTDRLHRPHLGQDDTDTGSHVETIPE